MQNNYSLTEIDMNVNNITMSINNLSITYIPLEKIGYCNVFGFTETYIQKNDNLNCVICSEEIEEDLIAHNAEPIKNGLCCYNCNYQVVLPERLKRILSEKNENACISDLEKNIDPDLTETELVLPSPIEFYEDESQTILNDF